MWTIAVLFVIGVYFSLTWFFFGSSHPCGILEARQRPYVVNRYSEGALRSMKIASDNYMRVTEHGTNSFNNPNTSIAMLRESEKIEDVAFKRFNEAIQKLSDAPKNATRDLHEEIWNHYSPAKCLWEALA